MVCWRPVVSRKATRLFNLPLRTTPHLGDRPPRVTSRGTLALGSTGFSPSTDCCSSRDGAGIRDKNLGPRGAGTRKTIMAHHAALRVPS